MGTGIGRNLTEIALFLASISVITLLVGNADATVKIIKAGAGAYDGLLRTVTLQNGYGNPWN